MTSDGEVMQKLQDIIIKIVDGLFIMHGGDKRANSKGEKDQFQSTLKAKIRKKISEVSKK